MKTGHGLSLLYSTSSEKTRDASVVRYPAEPGVAPGATGDVLLATTYTTTGLPA